MKKNINLTIGTEIDGQGGVQSVFQVMQSYGFFIKTNNKFIASHTDRRSVLGINKLFVFFLAVISVIYYCTAYKVGVAHFHMATRGSFTRKSILIRIANFFHAKIIIHLHAGRFSTFYCDECSHLKQKRIKKTFNTASKVIVLSKAWKEFIDNVILEHHKSCIIYNSVPPFINTTKISKELNILFLGKLDPDKGVADLISAFGRIAKDFPSTKLLLGGIGDTATYINQAESLGIIRQVVFLGWVSGKLKDKYLGKTAIYCLPSYYEGLPMGVLEAMAAEVTVVASAVGGIPDAIEDRKEGLLINAGDVLGLSNALTELLSDNALRLKYAAAAKLKYERYFSPNVVIPQLEDLYSEILNIPESTPRADE